MHLPLEGAFAAVIMRALCTFSCNTTTPKSARILQGCHDAHADAKSTYNATRNDDATCVSDPERARTCDLRWCLEVLLRPSPPGRRSSRAHPEVMPPPSPGHASAWRSAPAPLLASRPSSACQGHASWSWIPSDARGLVAIMDPGMVFLGGARFRNSMAFAELHYRRSSPQGFNMFGA